MKKFCWFCSGHVDNDKSIELLDIFVESGTDGIEWTIPVKNPYKEQEHLKQIVLDAYKKIQILKITSL